MAKNLRRWEVERGFTAAEEAVRRSAADLAAVAEVPAEPVVAAETPTEATGDDASGSGDVRSARPAADAPRAKWAAYARELGHVVPRTMTKKAIMAQVDRSLKHQVMADKSKTKISGEWKDAPQSRPRRVRPMSEGGATSGRPPVRRPFPFGWKQN